MTYEEAVEKKNSIEEKSVIKDNAEFKIWVTPKNNPYLNKYLDDIRGFYPNLTDAVSKKYALDKEFWVYGIYCTINIVSKIDVIPLENQD